MQFSNFKDNFGRKAVLFMLSDQSQEQVYGWASAAGFDLSMSFSGNPKKPEEFDFHVTLICSENEVFILNEVRQIAPITTTFVGYEVLGQENNVPVILVDKTTKMMETRTNFEKVYGVYDNWPVWKAHMSLSYNWHGTPNLETLPLPNFPITFDKLKISNLD